ncbi:MAG TPA: VOC family protein [Chloroflexota bacterium]|jgi:catechol 2,3-dioxygenase-like lactoylglutathione lyase family enzyme|nr:VOC family protein [Chloroflexota bacterium]
MTARIKHIAIVSDNFALSGRFYEAVFGMRTSPESRPESAVNCTDGYVGLNINPRKPGRQAGFDHFGFEVDDVEAVFERARASFPECEYLKRPSNRPFAGISMHDPAGQVFDLSQEGMSNRGGVYVLKDGGGTREPRVTHFVLRSVIADKVTEFYRTVLQLDEVETRADDPRHYLTDGVVTLVVAPWKIGDYAGSGIERPALDHIGFAVDDLEEFQSNIKRITSRNAQLAPRQIDVGPEGEVRQKLLATCRYGQQQLSDPDCVLLDVHQAS